MLVVEGRKEDILAKYSEQVKAEKKLVSNYLSGSGLGSIYDYLITDLFMIDTNFKYLDDILANYYRDWKKTESEIEPANFEFARQYVESTRDTIDRLVEAIKFFDVHKKKYKHQELRKYFEGGYFDFFRETEQLRDKFNKKKGEKEAVKIFDNDNLLVVRPTSYESSCLYGAGTKWCTASKTSSKHYENYSESGALYYFITRGVDPTNRFYKVALFKDDLGYNQWWDATDIKLDEKNVELLESAYGPAIKEVEKDFNTLGIRKDYMKEIFEGEETSLSKELSSNGPELTLMFQTLKAEGSMAKLKVSVLIGPKTKQKTISTFDLEVISELENNRFIFRTVYTPVDNSNVDKLITPSPNPVFFELPDNTSSLQVFYSYCMKIYREFYYTIKQKRELWEKFLPKGKIFISAYSPYTFKNRNVGLIKKLTDWLDSGKKGGKFDFLVDSNILRKQGNSFISVSTGESITGAGYLSSFFAAAVNAGIISLERKGRKVLIKKGPNYRKFKQGTPIVRV